MESIAKALVAFQSELTPVDKKADNPFFKSKYAPLPEVMQAIQPIMAKNKLAVVQMVTNLEGSSALQTIIMHESGEKIESVMPLLLPKNDPQGQGSAITYARRYALMSALGIVAEEDDDGNKAVKGIEKNGRATRQPKPMSDKQADMLMRSWSELTGSEDIEEMKKALEPKVGKDYEDWNSWDASKVISSMMKSIEQKNNETATKPLVPPEMTEEELERAMQSFASGDIPF